MKLVQLNIERNKHLERVTPFLSGESPDIICLQEVMHRSLPAIERSLEMSAMYIPMARLAGFEDDANGDIWGMAILSKIPPRHFNDHRYYGNDNDEIPTYTWGDWRTMTNPPIRRSLAVATIETTHGTFTIGTTHFTWTPDGRVNDSQRRDMSQLRAELAHYDDIVLCGDFNIPRGNELYHELCKSFTDNIPKEVTTTLDRKLHRKKGLEYVVDYIWTTPIYRVRDVRVVCGISDHCAVVATLDKTFIH